MRLTHVLEIAVMLRKRSFPRISPPPCGEVLWLSICPPPCEEEVKYDSPKNEYVGGPEKVRPHLIKRADYPIV